VRAVATRISLAGSDCGKKPVEKLLEKMHVAGGNQ